MCLWYSFRRNYIHAGQHNLSYGEVIMDASSISYISFYCYLLLTRLVLASMLLLRWKNHRLWRTAFLHSFGLRAPLTYLLVYAWEFFLSYLIDPSSYTSDSYFVFGVPCLYVIIVWHLRESYRRFWSTVELKCSCHSILLH